MAKNKAAADARRIQTVQAWLWHVVTVQAQLLVST